MPTRIDGHAAQTTQLPVETPEAEVNRSENAATARATAGAPATKDASTHPDSIEQAEAKPSSADEPRHAGDARGPEVPAYLMHATGGRSGHAALEEESGKNAGTDGGAQIEARGDVGPRELPHAPGSEKQAHFDAHDRYAKAKPLPMRARGQAGNKPAEGERPKDAPEASSRPPVRFAAEKELIKTSGALSHHDFKHGKVDLISGEAKSALGARYEGGKLNAEATLSAGAYLVNAQGELKGQLGAVDLKGSANARIGLDAQVGASAVFDLKAGKVGGKAGVDAFAGAAVGAKGSAELGGVAVGAEARAEAGLGFEAEGVLQVDQGKLTVRGDAGLCVGIGGDVQFGVTVDAKKVFNELKEADAYLEKKLDAGVASAGKAAVRAIVGELANATGGTHRLLEKAEVVATSLEAGAQAGAETLRALASRQ